MTTLNERKDFTKRQPVYKVAKFQSIPFLSQDNQPYTAADNK